METKLIEETRYQRSIFIGNAAANGLNYDGVFGEKTHL